MLYLFNILLHIIIVKVNKKLIINEYEKRFKGSITNKINPAILIASNLLKYLENENNKEENFKLFIFDWLEVLVHAIIVVVICFSFLFRIATIDGPSMENTLLNGERVVISNLFYEPKVGDIVVISRNKENSILV